MSDESDERPKVFMQSKTPEASVTVTVLGSSGEKADDIDEIAEERFDHAVRENHCLQPEADEERGVQ